MAATKFEVPAKVAELQKQFIEKVAKKGKIKVGVNEVTKAVERGTAKLVVLANDVSPPEIVMHLPVICKEKSIPFSYANTRKELGEQAGISVAAAAIAITDEGDAKKELTELAGKLAGLAG